jgi:diaminopimelate epimerase
VTLRFSKMHGAGNDFVLIDRRGSDAPALPAELIARIADRHRGVGFDQLITLEPAREVNSVAAYAIWNADGSAAAQCGNGARCVAAWLRRDGACDASLRLDSPSGTVEARCLDDGEVEVDMGRPDFDPAKVPVNLMRDEDGYSLQLDGWRLRFDALSMGNPHVVIEVPDVAQAEVTRIAALLQQHVAFPDGCNVGFAQVCDRGHVLLRVVERGVGETLACGSGACAAAASLMRAGRVDRELSVSLPGGTLRIEWPDDSAPLRMAGPATFVFEGEFHA